MKHFFYITEYKTARYGSNITNTVYQIKQGRPVRIGEAKYNTGSYRGHEHEAVQVLVDAKVLPNNVMSKPSSGYLDFDKLNKVYTLDAI